MAWEQIEIMLRNKIGLDAKAIGSRAIVHSIRDRMKASGIFDVDRYFQKLQFSSHELEALIEETIVPETWFFRDTEAFNFLHQHVKFDWIPTHSHLSLRVLSLPCSTGEEPYSIAMTLIDAGLAPKYFHIDAVDISKQALEKAERGVYGRNSFRGKNLDFRDRYFHQIPDGYQLSPAIARTVNFRQSNALEPLFLHGEIPYNIIFCRNLLIYFHANARQRVIEVLDRLLSPSGLLFVGSAETGSIVEQRFDSLRTPMTFAYRKREKALLSSNFSPTENARRKLLEWRTSHRGKDRFHDPAKLSPGSTQQPSASSIPSPPSDRDIAEKSREGSTSQIPPKTAIADSQSESILERARTLANSGSLNEASHLCETYLSQNRTDAEAYVLLGEVLQAAGNEDRAEQCFHKAVYLQPNHSDALFHLALLKEHRGDWGNASIIRQRIQRLLKSQGE